MNPEFEIECIFKVTLRDKCYVTARLLNSNLDWKLSDKSKLGEVEIENWLDIPRESDTLGNQRLDLFAFALKNTGDKDKLKVNQVVELIP